MARPQNSPIRFAPVAPIQVLEGLYAHSPKTFGNYHLLLAHHVVEHKQRFADLFKRIADDGNLVDVIMDNSIVELGEAVSIDMVAEACGTIKQDNERLRSAYIYPVLPDIMGDGPGTLQWIERDYTDWVKNCQYDGFMAVCQGESLHHFQNSLHVLGNRAAYPEIRILGIPRILHKQHGSRVEACRSARGYMGTHLLHMLGFSDDIEDDIRSAAVLGLGGIESAVPLRLREVLSQYTKAEPRNPAWFDQAQVDPMMIDNLQIARDLFGRI